MSIITDDWEDKEVIKKIWSHSSSRIGVVTSFADNIHNIMTVEWMTQIQFNPPTYLITLVKGYETVEMIQKTGEFGLSFLADDQVEIAKVAGKSSLKKMEGENKYDHYQFPVRDGKKITSKVLIGSVLSLECKVIQTIERENAIIFIGEAILAEYNTEKKPLCYHEGEFHKLGEKIDIN